MDDFRREYTTALITAGKSVSAGLATIGLTGASIGVGLVSSALVFGLSRNPSELKNMFKYAMLGAAVGLLALLMAFLIMFTLKGFKINLTKAVTEDSRVETCKKTFFFTNITSVSLKKKKVKMSLNIGVIFTDAFWENPLIFTILCSFIAIILISYIVYILKLWEKTINFNAWCKKFLISIIVLRIFLGFFYALLKIILYRTDLKNSRILFTIIQINGVGLSLITIPNALLLIYKNAYKYHENNIFFIYLYKILQKFVIFLYNTKLLDKIFKIVWFKFFNTNQNLVDVLTLCSLLSFVGFTVNAKLFIKLLVLSLQESNLILTEDAVFFMLLFFICGILGLYYRLLINFSCNILAFVFLYNPKFYYKILVRNKSKNKPRVHFFYNEIPFQRWFKSNQVAFFISMLLCLNFFYFASLNILQNKKKFWKDQNTFYETHNQTLQFKFTIDRTYHFEILAKLTIKEHMYTRLLQKNNKRSLHLNYYLEKLQQEKRELAALYKPETAEIIFKYFPDELITFRNRFSKETYDNYIQNNKEWLKLIQESEHSFDMAVNQGINFKKDYPAIYTHLENEKKIKRFLLAEINPELAESLYKDFPEELANFRKSYPIILEEFHKKMIIEADLSIAPITIDAGINANIFENIGNDTGDLYLNIIIGTSFWIIYVLLIIKKWLKSNKIK